MDEEFARLIAALNKLEAGVTNIEGEVKETNTILKDFMAMSVKQWEQQHKFNEMIVDELKSIKGILATF